MSGGVWWGREGDAVFKVAEKTVGGEGARLQPQASWGSPAPRSKPGGGCALEDQWADADGRGRRDEVGETEGVPGHLGRPGQSVGGRPCSPRPRPRAWDGGPALWEALRPLRSCGRPRPG